MTMVIRWVRNANVSVSEEYAVRRQLESYEANRGEVEGLRRLDGTRPADELAAVVTRWIAGLQDRTSSPLNLRRLEKLFSPFHSGWSARR